MSAKADGWPARRVVKEESFLLDCTARCRGNMPLKRRTGREVGSGEGRSLLDCAGEKKMPRPIENLPRQIWELPVEMGRNTGMLSGRDVKSNKNTVLVSPKHVKD